MTMTFILGIIAEKMPKTNQVPLLGKYIIFGLCTMLVAMIVSTYLKMFSGYMSAKLRNTKSKFGQKLRRFIGSPLRIICLIMFQAFNVFSILFILYKYIVFTNRYGFANNDLEINLLPAQKRLVNHLFKEKEYDNDVSMVITEKDRRTDYTFEYWAKLVDLKLVDIDEPREQMTVSAEFVQTWKDVRLQWEPEDYDNITVISMRQAKVWSPPFAVFSASEVVEHRDADFRTVTLWHDGRLMTDIPMKISTSCGLQVHNFPFDIQTCELHVGITAFETSMYAMEVSIPEDISRRYCYMGNSGWTVVDITSKVRRIRIADTAFDNRKTGVIGITLKRNPSFYLYMIVLPTFIINAISIIGVFLKNTERIDRMTIGLTHIMTMTFILGIIAEKMPKTKSVPFLGKYIIFGLCTMLVAMTASTYLKKFSVFMSEKLRYTRSKFGQKLRRFIGSPLRILCLIVFQAFNIFSALFILYKYIHFANQYVIPEGYCFNNVTEKLVFINDSVVEY